MKFVIDTPTHFRDHCFLPHANREKTTEVKSQARTPMKIFLQVKILISKDCGLSKLKYKLNLFSAFVSDENE